MKKKFCTPNSVFFICIKYKYFFKIYMFQNLYSTLQFYTPRFQILRVRLLLLNIYMCHTNNEYYIYIYVLFSYNSTITYLFSSPNKKLLSVYYYSKIYTNMQIFNQLENINNVINANFQILQYNNYSRIYASLFTF